MISVMKIFKIVAACAAALFVATAFSGCNLFGKKTVVSKAPASYPVTVNGVTLAKAPADAVVLSPSLAQIVSDMGFGSAISGRSEECDAPDAVKALPSVGSMLLPDADKLIALKPDCVLTQSKLPDELQKKLDAAGIPAVVIPTAGGFDELDTEYKAVGMVFAGETAGAAKGEAQIKKLNDELDAVTKQVSAASAKQPLTAVYVTDAFGHVATGDTVMGRLVKASGCVNAAESAVKWTASADQLKNAAIIFCPEPLVDKVKGLASLKGTPAVVNNRVYGVSASGMERQSLAMADAVESMARKAYPGAWTAATTAAASQTGASSSSQTAAKTTAS